MLAKTHYPYILIGSFVALLLLHWLWCQFVAYPISFERNLKKGKSWVYIPLRWQGAYKVQITLVSRLLLVVVIAVGVLVLCHFTRRTTVPWIIGYGLGIGVVVTRLNALWLKLRYKQQEDAYYFLHDELRVRLENEGKDIADSAFKSLAAYQHQNLLRKADEQGRLIQTLRSQSKLSRKHRKEIKAQEPVET
jgi:hypothetical protein